MQQPSQATGRADSPELVRAEATLLTVLQAGGAAPLPDQRAAAALPTVTARTALLPAGEHDRRVTAVGTGSGGRRRLGCCIPAGR
jgi:hypothetical protein